MLEVETEVLLLVELVDTLVEVDCDVELIDVLIELDVLLVEILVDVL